MSCEKALRLRWEQAGGTLTKRGRGGRFDKGRKMVAGRGVRLGKTVVLQKRAQGGELEKRTDEIRLGTNS